MVLVAAIDVGGTKTRIEIFSEAREPLDAVVFDTPRSGDVTATLAQAVEKLAGEKKMDVAAVASPGPSDPVKGIILNPPNLSKEWWNLRITDRLGELLGCPVALENDANLGALGESEYGAGHEHSHVLYITVSTGIGTGLAVNGHIFGGSRGFAGELGHTTVTEKDRICGCGRRGCVEAVASGTAIAKQALNAGWSPPNGERPTARAVAEAAAAGDKAALEILTEAATYLGKAIVNFLYAYDPDVVLLGGGVAQSDLFLDLMRKAVDLEPMMPAFRGVPVLRAALGERSVIYGTRALAEKVAAESQGR